MSTVQHTNARSLDTTGLSCVGSDMTLVDVALVLKDQNDNQPSFPFPFAHVEERAENLPPSSDQANVYLPLASDPDSPPFSIKQYRLRDGLPSNAFFTLMYHPLAANPMRRLYLVPKQPLDHEAAASHFLQVVAEERVPSQLPAASASAGTGTGGSNILNVTINVRDENDNPPVFARTRYTIDLPESTRADGTVVVLQVRPRRRAVH